MMISVVAAYVVKGMCGFANTLVFGTMMSFHSNTISITPMELIVGYPSNALMAWKERRSLELKIWLPLAGLVVLGGIPGAFLLKTGGTAMIKVIFGAIVVFVGLEMLLRERRRREVKSKPLYLWTIGVLSGVMCGLFGVGALLAAYMSKTAKDSHSFKGNMCMVFVVENTFRLILYSCTGILTLEILRTALLLLPLMALGLGAGMWLSHHANERRIRKWVVVMLLLSGLSLLLTNIALL